MEFQPLTAILLVLASSLLLIASRLRKGKGKPPHPPSWPIIGHLHLLNREKNRPLHRILSSLSERYGPILHLDLGYFPLLLISSSHLAKECFTTNDRVFASRPCLSTGKYLSYNNKGFIWAPYGSYWREIRKICTLQLFSAQRIEALKDIRADEISLIIRSLFESCQRNDSTVNMKSRLAEFTYNIIVRMVAGKKMLATPHSEDDSQEAQHFKELLEETLLLGGTFNVGDYLPFLKWLDLQGLKAAMKKLQKKRDVFMQKLVDDHRERQSTPGQQTQDLIDVLISVTDSNDILSDNNDTLSLITAGTDTSAVTIQWALAALLQSPHILRKAQLELDAHIGRDRVIEESDLHELKYLQAIVKETLRLYLAAPLLLPRESTEACTVGGFHVPAGTRLMVNVWAIQRDPAVWERPTEFDPERFLKSEREIDVKGQDFKVIPFGSGRRMCPGMSLALCVVSYTLARLLQSFEWSLPAGTIIDMREGMGVTMRKAVPLEAVIQPRLPLHLY